MTPSVYNKIEQIINITGMANKWLMWCEQNLPEHAVFVPSIFQMRDAFSHVMSMFTLGFLEQSDKTGDQFDEKHFFESKETINQLSEITAHTFRAFFDVADFIVERLLEESAGNGERFHLLSIVLVYYDDTIIDLRTEKANPSSAAYDVATRWDSILQVLTSAYAFSDLMELLYHKVDEVQKKILAIEGIFEEDMIKSHDPKFYEKKTELMGADIIPEEYKKFQNMETLKSEVLEDPSTWQQNIKDTFQAKMTELDEQLTHYRNLEKVLASTKALRKITDRTHGVQKFIWALVPTVITTIISLFLSNWLFLSTKEGESPALLNLGFLIRFCCLFAVVEIIALCITGYVQKQLLKRAQKHAIEKLRRS